MSNRASYHEGFAPRDGRPLYPSLWKGCVGAWCPSLGPTGLTLRDWSDLQNHGTLTGTEPEDWVVNGGGYAVALDGTSAEYIDCGAVPLDSSNWTMSMWIYMRAVSGTYRPFSYHGSGPTFWSSVGAFKIVHGGSVDFDCGYTMLINTWTHLCVARRGSDIRAYVNGRQTASSSSFSVTFTASSSVRIGGSTAFNENTNGFFDGVMLHSRGLSADEALILARRRGIAHELAPRRRTYSIPAAGGNRRRRVLIGS